MELSYDLAHKVLSKTPSAVIVQTTDGELIPLLKTYRKRQLHVYPGSFNPLHDCHRAIFTKMKEQKRTGEVAFFELSINRFDKPPVSVEELKLRLRQFVGYAPVLVTNVAKFSEKAEVLRGTHPVIFHVGADTITRILAHSSIQEVAGLNCEFVYYERLMNGTMVALPEKMPVNCHKGAEIPKALMGISSTALRNAGKVLT
jgi:Cytidylyltransferase-like